MAKARHHPTDTYQAFTTTQYSPGIGSRFGLSECSNPRGIWQRLRHVPPTKWIAGST